MQKSKFYVIVHLESRRVVHDGVTYQPTDAWVAQQLREATPFDEKPKYLMCDHDSKFGAGFERVAYRSGIELKRTTYHTPVANAICERLEGSLRRECLDHVLVLGVRQLVRMLTVYIRYFNNQARRHQGIEQRIPEASQSPHCEPKAGKVIAFTVLNGLHHDYPVSRLFEARHVHGTCHTGLSLGRLRPFLAWNIGG